jgi:inner membrane protein involved in colicin E2 resistance
MITPLQTTSPAALPGAGATRFSTVLKMASITFLVLLLLIPLAMVQSVLGERLQRRDTAVRDVTSAWGSEQVVVGPVLVVPYRYAQKTWKDQVVNGRVERLEISEMLMGRAFFLPSVVKAEAELEPSRLHRGIYESVVYRGSITLNGNRSLRFAPVGVTNDVQVSSAWPDPSFQGAFLPSRRDVRADGFTARWQVSYYGRSYPQQWTDRSPVTPALINASLFGVDLVPAMDSYRFVERSIKYGVLVIALVFTAFFLFEVLAAARIHPFQYTLVGAALCLFYLALLALSEVLAFGAAYWIGAAAATLMIALYCVKALRSSRRAGVAAAGLGAVFGFLYVILRLQDLSLLVGTAGLFVVLAIVMYVTRNIDWYARDRG